MLVVVVVGINLFLSVGMASLCKNLAALLLFLIASPCLHNHLFIQAASTSSTITIPRIIVFNGLGSNEDDGEDDGFGGHISPPTKVLSSVNIPPLHQEICEYNFCLENQEPCDQTATQPKCLCPGISGSDQPPHPPRIQALLPVTEGDNKGKVEVQWCAPASVVSGYRVVLEGEDISFDFEDARRRGLVGSLEVGTRVCVEAINKAGHSTRSCTRYETPKTSEHNLFAWVIGGGVALLLIIIIAAVLLWKYKVCRKGKEDSADGLGNPSYSTEGTL